MLESLTFGQCLEKVMQKHKLTTSNLSLLIGARSDLKHVLADDATHARRSKLFARLNEIGVFDEDDYAQLSRSLEISRLGVERYRFQHAIAEILSGQIQAKYHDLLTEDGRPLSERFLQLFDAEKVEIICFNCCFHALISAIAPLFEDKERDIHMRHYIQSDSSINVAAEYVAVVMPILFDSRYRSFYRPSSIDSKIPSLGGNQLLIRAVINNQITEQYFIFVNNQTAYELSSPEACHMFAFVERVLKGVYPQPVAIKETNPYKLDFSSLCMTFLSHELNRATFDISNDLSFQQTPTDIALAAFKEKGYASNEETAKIISRTLSIHEQRYQNQYRKKKMTCRVMTKAGCKRFLETGKMTDHFIGLRPFTPEERKVIFGSMLQAAQKNSCFSPLLLIDADFRHRYNLVCYENLGVSIDAKDTDYDIGNGYQSVFLMLPEFTRQYSEYYRDILVGEKCHSRKRSIELLEDMYEDFLQKYDLLNEHESNDS